MSNQMYRKALIILLCLAFVASLTLAMSRAPKPSKSFEQAPDFTLKDIYGRTHTLSQYRGKLVFLNFWATWCPPCRYEMPFMQQVYLDSDKNKFVMLAVNVSQNEDKVRGFAAKNSYVFPILLDTHGDVAAQYGVRGMPATFIIDQQGKIMAKKAGLRHWTWEEFVPLIK